MDLDGKRILVIGGAGLVGSHVVEALLEEPVGEVVVFDNFSRGCEANLAGALSDPRCRVFELGGELGHIDILDKAVEEADAVVHLAALWLLHCQDFPQSAFDVNIRGTFDVLWSCVRNRVERVVYSSSASVYGDAVFEPMTEDHPFNNQTFYGATKIAGEQMFKAFHHRYGLKGAGLRYMNVYGPRQDYHGAYVAVMMKILDCIARGERPTVYGDGKQSYDFVHVRDVARANVCALKAEVPFGFYNVGRGEKTSIKELAELLLELSGSDLEIEYLPAGETFVTNRLGSPDAAKRDLGFEWQVDLREGMQSLIDWRNADKRRSST
ncbi:MAG: NAD-dependent epimerase/dehydratase family protein [Myxococcales bacterium]|nr:NAD-dependent epimerase/dehydratase family protein [Myxococcales bacterium]